LLLYPTKQVVAFNEIMKKNRVESAKLNAVYRDEGGSLDNDADEFVFYHDEFFDLFARHMAQNAFIRQND